jgi:predicted DNA-binding transcriptional regulator AlpA
MSQTTVRSISPPTLRLWLTATQVAERYGVSIPTVWTWAKTKRLPVPHKLAENTTRWRLSELDAHDDKQAQRGKYEPKKRPGRQA